MNKLKKILNAYLPPITWALVIFLFSSQSVLPGFSETPLDFIFKKTAHMFVYLVLYLLLARAVLITVNKNTTKKQMIFPIILCILYATTDELHQSLVPGRYATIRDIGYDMFGVSVGFLAKYNFI